MLSTKVLSNSSAASSYYSHSDYYGSEAQGIWFGLGADDLGVKGIFTAKSDHSFNHIIQGILPNGQVLGRKTKDGLEHCPGVDLTFSAPKSFSIQMLVLANDTERMAMEEALVKSVNTALGYIEVKGYAVARKGKDGQIKEKINRLSFANFTHTTNRNLEPQAHVHCFLANVAGCKDGKFRSLDFRDILSNNKLFGQVFRNELALETKKLGYDIIQTILSDGSSAFELSKIDNRLIDAFSTRRKEIEVLYKLYDVRSKEGKDNIVINSRKAKKQAEPNELNIAWKNLEQKVSQELNQEKVTVVNRQNIINHLKVKDLVVLSLEDATSRSSVVSLENLLKKALKHSIGNYGVDEIEKAFEDLKAKGVIIGNNGLYTSKALLDKEKKILEYAKESSNTSKAIVKEDYLGAHIEKYERVQGFKMNKQQKETLIHILTSKDKIVTIEGLPGVGKSTVLDAVRDISLKQVMHLSFEGLAPTASAAKTLKESANLQNSNTLHSFLNKYQGYIEGRGSQESLKEQRDIFKNAMIFVDEASLISTNIMHKLLTLQKKLDFRLVLTGDTKQLAAVEAGKPFVQILSIIKPAKMDLIVRQEKDIDRKAIIAASKGDTAESLLLHQTNIIEVKNENESKYNNIEKLSYEAVTLYLQKSVQEREETLVIAPTRILRDAINEQIMSKLQESNGLTGETFEFKTLRTRDMSLIDCQLASMFFPKEDILKFNKAYKNGIDKNEYYRVKSVDTISNSLILTKYEALNAKTKKSNNLIDTIGKILNINRNREYIFNLRENVDYSKKFEVFNERSLKLQKNLKIVFTKNNKEQGLINSETATIKEIKYAKNIGGDNSLILQFEDKQLKEVPLSKLKSIDYGYCATIHGAQGKTFDSTIAAINQHSYLNTNESWLVSISRHRKNLNILLEDQKRLERNIKANKTNKVKDLSAIELDKRNKPANKKGNRIHYQHQISATEIHNMLCNSIPNLAKILLPNITDKKIIVKRDEIRCGSISINCRGQRSGAWYRHSTGKSGNLFDLIQESQNLQTTKAAVEWSKNYLGIYESNIAQHNLKLQKSIVQSVPEPKNIKHIMPIIPVPDGSSRFNPERVFYNLLKNKNHKLEAVYEYHNIKNELCGYVTRIKNTFTQEKMTLPAVYTEDKKGDRRWISKGFGDNRPLYNEQSLSIDKNHSNKPVLIVEGEKTANHAKNLYPEFNVLSWSGGASSYKNSNWQVLRGRDVIIWPDNDRAGIEAAIGIKTILTNKNVGAKSCQIVDLSKLAKLPAKWDLADPLPKYFSKEQVDKLLFGMVASTDANISGFTYSDENKTIDTSRNKNVDNIISNVEKSKTINEKISIEM